MELCNLAVLLVPSAWHTGRHYETSIDEADAIGILVDVVSMPSARRSPSAYDFDRDVAEISLKLVGLFARRKKVLLVTHGYYGSLPACDAVSSVEGMAHGNLVGIMFVAAQIPFPGLSLRLLIDQDLPEWVEFQVTLPSRNRNAPSNALKGNECSASQAVDIFYNKSPLSVRNELAQSLVPMSTFVVEHLTESEDWANYPCYYVKCGNDQALPIAEQEANIKRLQYIRVLELADSDHLPFESSTRELLGLVVKAARGQFLYWIY